MHFLFPPHKRIALEVIRCRNWGNENSKYTERWRGIFHLGGRAHTYVIMTQQYGTVRCHAEEKVDRRNHLHTTKTNCNAGKTGEACLSDAFHLLQHQFLAEVNHKCVNVQTIWKHNSCSTSKRKESHEWAFMRKPFVHYQIFMHLLTTAAQKKNFTAGRVSSLKCLHLFSTSS